MNPFLPIIVLLIVAILLSGLFTLIFVIATQTQKRRMERGGVKEPNEMPQVRPFELLNDETVGAFVHSANKIMDWFGYWPTFHDAEILSIQLNREVPVTLGSVSIEMRIFAYEISTRQGKFTVDHHCLMDFRFVACSDIKLEGFNQQNQCGKIVFGVEKQGKAGLASGHDEDVVVIQDGSLMVPDSVLRVLIQTEFGIEGGFKCHHAEVVALQASNEDGNQQ